MECKPTLGGILLGILLILFGALLLFGYPALVVATIGYLLLNYNLPLWVKFVLVSIVIDVAIRALSWFAKLLITHPQKGS